MLEHSTSCEVPQYNTSQFAPVAVCVLCACVFVGSKYAQPLHSNNRQNLYCRGCTMYEYVVRGTMYTYTGTMLCKVPSCVDYSLVRELCLSVYFIHSVRCASDGAHVRTCSRTRARCARTHAYGWAARFLVRLEVRATTFHITSYEVPCTYVHSTCTCTTYEVRGTM